MMRSVRRAAVIAVGVGALALLTPEAAFAGSYTLKQGDDYVTITNGSTYVQDKECDFHTAYTRIRGRSLGGSSWTRSYYAEDGSCHGDGTSGNIPLLGSTMEWQVKMCETHPGDDSCTSYHAVPRSALR